MVQRVQRKTDEGMLLRREYLSIKNVMFVGAHPDDIELGCLGTIMNYVEKGRNIICVVASDGEIGNPAKANRQIESIMALTGAGVNKENIVFLQRPDTRLIESYNVIFGELEKIARTANVQRVFFHTDHDRHQDHRAICEITLGATRFVPDQIAYQSNSSTLPNKFAPNLFVDIGPYIKRKLNLLAHHKSQGDRQYMHVSSVTALARNSGENSKSFAYAEAFEILRLSEK